MNQVLTDDLAGHAFLRGMRAEHIARLAEIATAIAVPARHRLFEEGGRADRIWLIRTGSIALDLRVPGRAPLIVETIGSGEVIGLSWICPPYEWQYGAEAFAPTEAFEVATTAIIRLCDDDPVLGYQITRRLMVVAARRLHATRIRLLDLYAAPGQQLGML